jgi:hypothetical protein
MSTQKGKYPTIQPKKSKRKELEEMVKNRGRGTGHLKKPKKFRKPGPFDGGN